MGKTVDAFGKDHRASVVKHNRPHPPEATIARHHKAVTRIERIARLEDGLRPKFGNGMDDDLAPSGVMQVESVEDPRPREFHPGVERHLARTERGQDLNRSTMGAKDKNAAPGRDVRQKIPRIRRAIRLDLRQMPPLGHDDQLVGQRDGKVDDLAHGS